MFNYVGKITGHSTPQAASRRQAHPDHAESQVTILVWTTLPTREVQLDLDMLRSRPLSFSPAPARVHPPSLTLSLPS